MDSVVGVAIVGAVVAGIVAIAPSIKMALDLAPYLYANTRCSARSGLILKKKDYEQLLGATSMKELFSLLEDTYYGTMLNVDMSEVSKKLEEDLFNTYEWMIEFVPKRIRPVIEAMKLRFVINDVKSAINACSKGKNPENLEHLDEDLKIKIESCNDMDSLSAVLKETPYEPDINKLDVYYYTTVLETINDMRESDGSSVFRDYWRKRIDIVNARIALRRINGVTDLKFIEGGYVDPKELDVTDRMQLESILSKKYDISESIEGSMFAALRKESSDASAKNALKAGTLVRYLIEKEIEVRNLNIVIKLKSEGFDSDTIWKMLS